MKTISHFEKDSSAVSIKKLQKDISQYLIKRFKIKHIWFPDYYEWYDQLPENEILDIVFFGDYPRKFIELNFNQNDKFRFWVLSTAAQKNICEIFSLPSESVQVIDRYHLYPFSNNTFEVSKDSTLTFNFIGQLREEKSLLLLIWTLYFLEKHFHFKMSINFYGTYSNSTIDHYDNEVSCLINSLNFKSEIKFHGHKPIAEWSQTPGIYISLSHYCYEDFNLSLAEAQNLGWPSITSAWGGHLDAKLFKNISIPFNYITDKSDLSPLVKLKALGIAQYIDTHFELLNSVTNEQKDFSKMPTPVNKLRVSELIQQSFKKWGPQLIYLLRDQRGLMWDFKQTRLLLKRFNNNYSDHKISSEKILILSNDDHDFIFDEEEWLILFKKYTIVFKSTLDFLDRDELLSLNEFEKIFIASNLKELPNLMDLINASIAKNCSIKYF